MEGKACILKDFFFDMNPIALRKAKIIYNRVKENQIVLSKDIKIIFFATFSYFFPLSKVGVCILRKRKFSKKKKKNPTYPNFFQVVT